MSNQVPSALTSRFCKVTAFAVDPWPHTQPTTGEAKEGSQVRPTGGRNDDTTVGVEDCRSIEKGFREVVIIKESELKPYF